MRVEGRSREDVLHDAARQLPTPLIVLLDDIDSESGLNVFAVLPVHALASFVIR
jgi:hypothetical protein